MIKMLVLVPDDVDRGCDGPDRCFLFTVFNSRFPICINILNQATMPIYDETYEDRDLSRIEAR